jgi:hypothetical protein
MGELVPRAGVLRGLRLSGAFGPLPWIAFAVLGGSCLAASVLVLWATRDPAASRLGDAESLALVIAGGVLVGVGFRRRAARQGGHRPS